MRKLTVLFISVIFAGCVSVPVNPPAEPDKHIYITVEPGTTTNLEGEEGKKTEKISKSMDVANPKLQYSYACRIFNNKAYMFITSIGTWDSKSLWADLKLIEENGIDEVIIYLNSPGGMAFQGLSIANELELFENKSGIPMKIEGRGIIASAAVPVFLVGSHRTVTKHTTFMLHPAKLMKGGFFITEEGIEDLEAQTRMMKMLRDSYATIVASHSKLSKKEVFEMMSKETWLTAEEAKKIGFVDEIK